MLEEVSWCAKHINVTCVKCMGFGEILHSWNIACGVTFQLLYLSGLWTTTPTFHRLV